MINKGTKINIKLSKRGFIYFLLCFAPIMATYASPIRIISMGEVFIGLAFMTMIGMHRHEQYTKLNYYLPFVVYICASTLLMSFFQDGISAPEVVKELGVLLIYIILIVYISNRMDIILFLNMYVKVAYICSVFLIIQEVCHLNTGVWIPGIIPNLPAADTANTSTFIISASRACSVFSEPAHFAQYVAIPLVYLLLKDKKHSGEIKKIAVIITALILSFSGNAVVVIGIAIASYYLRTMNKKNVKKILEVILLAMISAIALYFAYRYSVSVQNLFARFTSGEIFGKTASRFSGYIRIVRGYLVYNQFPLGYKIFGVGIGNYELFSMKNAYEALTSVTAILPGYVNGIQYYLTGGGIIGLIMYLLFVMKKAVHSGYFNRVVVVEFLALSAIAGLNTNERWFVFLIVLLQGNVMKAALAGNEHE